METVPPEARRGCQTPVVGVKNGYEPPCEETWRDSSGGAGSALNHGLISPTPE